MSASMPREFRDSSDQNRYGADPHIASYIETATSWEDLAAEVNGKVTWLKRYAYRHNLKLGSHSHMRRVKRRKELQVIAHSMRNYGFYHATDEDREAAVAAKEKAQRELFQEYVSRRVGNLFDPECTENRPYVGSLFSCRLHGPFQQNGSFYTTESFVPEMLTGCPNCDRPESGKWLTLPQVQEAARLAYGENVEVLDIKNANEDNRFLPYCTKATALCHRHGTWSASVLSVMKHGCPECRAERRAELDQAKPPKMSEVKARLQHQREMNVALADTCLQVGYTKPREVRFKCACGNEWCRSVGPGNPLQVIKQDIKRATERSACPKCYVKRTHHRLLTTNPGHPAVFYFMITEEVVKFGVTTETSAAGRRMKRLGNNLVEVSIRCPLELALAVERSLLIATRPYQVAEEIGRPLVGNRKGWTELRTPTPALWKTAHAAWPAGLELHGVKVPALTFNKFMSIVNAPVCTELEMNTMRAADQAA